MERGPKWGEGDTVERGRQDREREARCIWGKGRRVEERGNLGEGS